MAHWKEDEIRELLNVRGEEEIKSQVTGTVKDAMIYSNISKILASRGIVKTQQQVLNKLKALKKQYTKVHDHNRNRSGNGRMEWQFYDLCSNVFGHTALSNPVALSSSSDAGPLSASTPCPSETDMECSQQSPPSSQLLFDDTQDDTESSVSIIEPNSMTEVTSPPPSQGSQSEQSQGSNPTLRSNIFTVPTRKKKKTKVEIAAKAMSNILCEQLRELDSEWQAQEDARLQRFLQNERELQNNLLLQMVTMQENSIREQRQMFSQLVTQIQQQPPTNFTMPTHYASQTQLSSAFGPTSQYAQQTQSPTSFGPTSQYAQQTQSPTSFGPTSQYAQQTQSPTSFGPTSHTSQLVMSPTSFGPTSQKGQVAQSPTSFGPTSQKKQVAQCPTTFGPTSLVTTSQMFREALQTTALSTPPHCSPNSDSDVKIYESI